jgi:ribonucleoside-diphosphate reductase alpha chain
LTKLSENANAIAQVRYFEAGEDWEKLSQRVGRAISANELEKTKWADIFSEEIGEMNFIPGGRILRNSGKLKQSMLNCGCLGIADNIEAIGDSIRNALIMWKYGAGIGIDFTPLREKGRPLITCGGEASGLVSFLEIFDKVAHVIETGGQRRSGCLGMCKVTHPEIVDFINAKVEDGKLAYFNLSVAIDEHFLKAVENDSDWNLTFAGQTVRNVKAVELWNKILDSMIKHAEPGLINFTNFSKNNSFYFQAISCGNLCSELPLPEFGSCCLGSIVLPKFLSGKTTNWKKLEQSIHYAVRFLDDVLDVNFYPLKEMDIVAKDARRIGLGVMGLHDYLMSKQLRYGSDQSILEIERLFRFIRNVAYEASIALAIEKGAFPKFSKNDYCNASFIKKLPAKIRLKIKEHGIRNCTIITAPPTGTSSLLAEVSSGIEPIFSLAYKRKDRVSERYYIHPKLLEFLQSGEKERPDWLVETSDLSPEDHFEVQVAIQKYVDNAVSKTINCPKGTTISDLSKLLLEYLWDIKGSTIYVDGSRSGQVLNKLNLDEVKEYVEKNKIDTFVSPEDVTCAKGTCEI